MDPRERWDDMEEIHHSAAERKQSRIWTALPVKVLEDSDGFTVQLQPTIKGKNAGGGGSDDEMPTLDKVPVQFAAGGGFTITHPIKKGDEGIAVFSSRCIDGWWRDGDVQPALEPRMHNLSDAMYIPGIRSTKRKLGGNGQGGAAHQMDASQGKPASTTSVQIRSDDGQFYIELAAQGVVNIVCKTLNITASDSVNAKTPKFTITGELDVGGEIHSGATIKAASDVQANAGTGNVALNWSPAGAVSPTTHPEIFADPRMTDQTIAGYLNVATELPSIVSQIGDNFSISGAINLVQGPLGQLIPGASDIINQAHQVVNIINSQNFSALLPMLPGQIGEIAGNPTMQAIVHLISHDHHGVMAGKAITQNPVTGT